MYCVFVCVCARLCVDGRRSFWCVLSFGNMYPSYMCSGMLFPSGKTFLCIYSIYIWSVSFLRITCKQPLGDVTAQEHPKDETRGRETCARWGGWRLMAAPTRPSGDWQVHWGETLNTSATLTFCPLQLHSWPAFRAFKMFMGKNIYPVFKLFYPPAALHPAVPIALVFILVLDDCIRKGQQKMPQFWQLSKRPI